MFLWKGWQRLLPDYLNNRMRGEAGENRDLMETFTISWDYKQFKAAFYRKTGLDLDCYKDRQMERRIRQLMQRVEKPDFHLFYRYLVESAAAMDHFLNYLTINTSEFFRDVKVYNWLKEEIFPELLKGRAEKLLVWSAGCSIGAEPYTIAFILDSLKALERTQIIATDIDDKALQAAREGCYDFKYLQKTPGDYLHRYFDIKGESYYVKEALKNRVTFKKHNLLVDPPVLGCHMILCRNVFIYFKTETQDFLLERFSGALKPGGILVIGSSEYISNPERFQLSKRYNTIYQKK